MSEYLVYLEARRVPGEREFAVSLDGEHSSGLIDGLVSLVDEICSVTGLYTEDVIAQLENRMLG